MKYSEFVNLVCLRMEAMGCDYANIFAYALKAYRKACIETGTHDQELACVVADWAC